jgi:16S rRNA (adenine1518-N6/adenine1519-N6)-dimethyltransferase
VHQIQILKKYGLAVHGVRGQHLLVDENVQRKLTDSIAPRSSETIIEIGPGLGAITHGLVASGAHVIAIEKDPRFVEVLKGEFGGDYKNLTVVQGDILKTNFRKYAKQKKKLKIAGNIPYYITSSIFLRLIEHRDVIDSATLTVQREIADRIFAQPGTKAYGRLSILIRFHADVRRLFNVSRNCFSPKPAVDSTAIELVFRSVQSTRFSDEVFFDLVKAAFGGRRKNILNSIANGFCLKGSQRKFSKGEVKKLLEAANISESARADHLMLKDFARLAEVVGTG